MTTPSISPPGTGGNRGDPHPDPGEQRRNSQKPSSTTDACLDAPSARGALPPGSTLKPHWPRAYL